MPLKEKAKNVRNQAGINQSFLSSMGAVAICIPILCIGLKGFQLMVCMAIHQGGCLFVKIFFVKRCIFAVLIGIFYCAAATAPVARFFI